MYLLESGSDYDNPQWLDTQSSSSSTLNGADLAGLSSSAAINDNLLNSQRQSRRDGSDYNFCLSIDQSVKQKILKVSIVCGLGWLGSRVVSVLDSGAEGPGFKSQPRRCQVTVLGKLFTPIVPLFTKQRNW